MKGFLSLLKTILGTALIAGGVYLCASAYLPSFTKSRLDLVSYNDEWGDLAYAISRLQPKEFQGASFKPVPLALGIASILIGIPLYLPSIRRLNIPVFVNHE